MTIDRVSGCITQFTNGPHVQPLFLAPNAEVRFSMEALRDAAVVAYSAGHSLAGARITWERLVLRIPRFQDIPNEVDERHRTEEAAGRAMAFYRLAIRGIEANGRIGGRVIWVDAGTGRATAIQHLDLTNAMAWTNEEGISIGAVAWRPAGSDLAHMHLSLSDSLPSSKGRLVTLVSDDGTSLIQMAFHEAEGLLSLDAHGLRFIFRAPAAFVDALRKQLLRPLFGHQRASVRFLFKQFHSES